MAMSKRMWMREQERKRRERQKRARRRRNCAIIVVLTAIIVVSIILISNNDNPGNDNKIENIAENSTQTATQPPKSGTYTTDLTVDDIDTAFYERAAFAGNGVIDGIEMYGIVRDADFYAGVNISVDNVFSMNTSNSEKTITEQFEKKKFKKIFLSFGENELSWSDSDEFRIQYEKLIEHILKNQDNVQLYLIGIPPVEDRVSKAGTDGMRMSNIKDYNNQIKALVTKHELKYIDSVDILGNNKGFLPDGVSSDGISLNKAALIELLYYGPDEAYVPTNNDLDDIEEEEPTPEPEKDDEPEPTKKPSEQKKVTPEPEPTVNVLKKSVTDRKDKEG